MNKLITVLIALLLLTSCSANNADVQAERKNYDKLTILIEFPTKIPSDIDLIGDEINKITREKIGAEIEIIAALQFRKDEVLRKMKNEGRIIDLQKVPAPPNDYDEFIPLNDYLEKYCPDIFRLFTSDELDALKINGNLYFAPNLSDKYASMGIAMRKDILNKYAIEKEALRSLNDFDRLFAFLHEKEPVLSMVAPFRTNFSFFSRNDRYFSLINAPYNINDSGWAINDYATPEYRESVGLFRKWYLSGYLPDDMVIQKIHSFELVKAGKLFAYFCAYKPGIDVEESINSGCEMVTVPIREPIITNRSISRSGWGIALDCEHPDKAAEFLNILYCDSDILNLMVYGIEGIHYQLLDDGTIDNPDGITAENSGYHPNNGFIFPNQYITHVWNGNDPLLWKNLQEYVESVKVAVSLGFSFNDRDVKKENAAVSEVVSKYSIGLETGMLDTEIYLPLMLSEMEEAGGQIVMDAIQKQYDKWKISKK